MLDKRDLVRKLYSREGFNVEKIVDILEVDKLEVNKILKDYSRYSILTSSREFTIRKISDEEYTKLRKKSLNIKPLYMFALEMEKYLKNYDYKVIPEVYFALSYFFGQSSPYYDNHKSSFRYLFDLDVFQRDSKELKGEYLVSIGDLKHSIYVEFYKIAEGRAKDDYTKYHSPFSDLKEKEMKKIWFWFMAFVKNTVEYFKNNELAIKPFCQKIDYGRVVYGYKDEDFFIEQYLEDEAGVIDEEKFLKQYEEYSQKIEEKIKENSYNKENTEIISKIIEETNSKSLPRYEFNNIKFEIYKVAYTYLKEEKVEELNKKTDLLTELILHCFVFKEEKAKEKYFKENNQLENFTFTDFRMSLEQVKKELVEYPAKETIFDYYKTEYLQELKFSIINKLLDTADNQIVSDLISQILDKLNQINCRQKMLEIKTTLEKSNCSSQKEIIKIFSIC